MLVGDTLHVGSSPLTRGTPIKSEIKRLTSRFIPAYAGNSSSLTSSLVSSSVHPRLRGELHIMHYLFNTVNGSSPLTRGTLMSINRFYPHHRFIPAYAGNSSPLNLIRTIGSVHPRLRGELLKTSIKIRTMNGSSPLTRGTPSRLRWRLPQMRFIPAYAGNSRMEPQPTKHLSVHPRLRGELDYV